MTIGSAIAIYFVIWWLTLFMVLPFGVRSQHDSGTIAHGTDPGAPAGVNLWKKALWTTLLSGVFFGLFLLVMNSGVTLDDLPFFRPPSDR
ncbi:DUF1467 family protein [Methylobrevis pamukkalensis]|uniref:Uncharacterized protein n=1 Tax=Methylobrevis pamukkalensis TaxID=1439726 RepID=A0A1E3H839_9HYPH|nr:DUF1467 family protein [Methylobrevis pamukkalensis]ODN72509.1 hypothetical protein A6302_00255 [Methylobrevis pamukkalensis]